MSSHQPTLQSYLQTLVAFRSITDDHAANKAALEWIAAQLPNGFDITWYESVGHHSFVATPQHTTAPALLLAAHVDVVPGSDAVFTMQEKNERLIGRGVFDMKSAIACYLMLLHELGDHAHEHNLGLMVTSDEEHGGWHGTRHILEQGFRTFFVFLPDGGEDWRIQEAAKGSLRLRVDARGTCAHGSRPWEGMSANDTLMRFLCELSDMFAKEPCDDAEHKHHTITIGRIDGGEAANQVPDHAHALLDIRLASSGAKEDMLDQIERIKSNYHGIEYHEVRFNDYYHTDLTHPLIQTWRTLSKQVAHQDPQPLLAHGSSDANYFGEHDIPVLLVRPHGGGQHAEDEWIDAHDLSLFYEVFKQWVLSM